MKNFTAIEKGILRALINNFGVICVVGRNRIAAMNKLIGKGIVEIYGVTDFNGHKIQWTHAYRGLGYADLITKLNK